MEATTGKRAGKESNGSLINYEYNDEGMKETNKENGRDVAGTSSSRCGQQYSQNWKSYMKAIIIVTTVITLSYSILAATNPRQSRFTVITKMAPQHCGLNLRARLQNSILDKHNEIRSKVALGQYEVDDGHLQTAASMNKLNWDCELELEAQKKAMECDLVSKEKHDITGNIEEAHGENAFYFRTEEFDYSKGVLTGIERMGNEIAIAGIKDLKLSRYDKRIGHATQIIWGETRKVGCAIQECSARQDGSLGGQKYNVAVCKYFPTGNVFKASSPTSVYKTGDTGSLCSDGDFVDPTSGLCVTATWKKTEEE